MTGRVRLSIVVAVLAFLVLRASSVTMSAADPEEPTEQRTDCAAVSVVAPSTVVSPAEQSLRFSDVWGLTRGAGQTVAVIDTGVARHPLLPGAIAGGDFVSDGDGSTDCDAHGTVVAGLIAARPSPGSGFVGGAPDADILTIRQSSSAFSAVSAERETRDDGSTSSGYGDVDSMALAVRAAVDAGAGVINISEVACAPVGTPLGDDALADAIEYAAVVKDAVIVVAAGNLDGSRCRDQNDTMRGQAGRDSPATRTTASPARFDDYVLTVGSLDADGTPSAFSLAGPWVDIAAPGTDVTSLSPTGEGLADGTLDEEGRFSPFTGTSFATPFVSATAALVRSRYPDMSAREVIARIVRTAHAPAGGWDSAVGFGSLDPVAAVTGTAEDEPENRPATRLDARVTTPPEDRSDATVALVGSAGVILALASLCFLRSAFRRQEPS
ncbi:hypothetical protein ASG56_01785 [Rhodococcus sp. Leaf7]|uniref:type VII secretion-associated serine protease mycosin n=1 Tax=unclassified Rhodococcus (in: high G+C Gram-positive bacteria) TaxID=192944 RepID=UPI0006FDF3EF|nr:MULTISPECIES: type VII secretion-associated serine protease mycosin [unclassified Rhodococcus (in: high G+C Gram-positive bacteria)]KQU06433.1 hypothetical protein ASG56_01785 [Rhodococcus sp. Leaf7]KQU41951.1 hypothetical protein ASG64_01785 [Rhodococcus sp. Leaf247]